MHRERTQHPEVSFHAQKDSHPHTNAAVTASITRRGTIPARRLISAATRTARMQTTTVQRRPTLRAAVYTMCFSYNVPLWHFKLSGRHPSSEQTHLVQRGNKSATPRCHARVCTLDARHQCTPRCATTTLPPLALPDMALYRNGGG